MRPCFGFFQIIAGPANDNFFAMQNKVFQDFLEGQHLGAIVDDSQKNHAEGIFHTRHFVEFVNDDAGYLASFESDGDAHAFPV